MAKRSTVYSNKQSAFTIVELLIVIIVIAILALIVFVAYRSFSDRAEATVIESDLTQAAKQLAMDKAIDGSYPSDADDPSAHLSASTGVTYEYTADASTFCLSATKGDKAYHITNSGSTKEGVCAGHTAPSEGGEPTGSSSIAMQTITTSNCPTERTRAVDARDDHTYWVQKLADGKCWMLTNLAYAGGGVNSYGDSKAITDGTSETVSHYNAARYYIPPGSNPTSDPSDPSDSTDGSGQYGYLYNWCAAMGVQTGTVACLAGSVPSVAAADPEISICPSGWRLPTGTNTTGEFAALLSAEANSIYWGTDLQTNWLAQLAGYRRSDGVFRNQGTNGYYWSSEPFSFSGAYRLFLRPGPTANGSKPDGQSVRCVAS